MIPLPPNTEMIRAYLLEKGDVFIYNGTERKVIRLDKKTIDIGWGQTLGRNSRERVLLLKKDKKKSETQTIKELAAQANINYRTVMWRMSQMGWTLEKALSTPVKLNHHHYVKKRIQHYQKPPNSNFISGLL